MTKAKPTAKVPADKGPNDALTVNKTEAESGALALARVLITPSFRHGMVSHQLLKSQLSGSPDAPGLGDYADVFKERCSKAAKGDLKFASEMLAAQASTLDMIFAEMARRMACNMADYPKATEIFGRLALKAQVNSRATLEALAKLHQPREQTVRHVHVNEGGQAVIADEFHHHQTGGQEIGKTIEQPYAPGSGAAGDGPALPSPDPIGQGLPISGGERCEAVPNARRQG